MPMQCAMLIEQVIGKPMHHFVDRPQDFRDRTGTHPDLPDHVRREYPVKMA